MTEYNFPFERKKRICDELTGLSEGELPKTEEVNEEKKDVIDEKSDMVNLDETI